MREELDRAPGTRGARRPGAVPLGVLLLLAVGCGEDRREVPYVELLDDARAGQVDRVEACVEGETTRYRYERAGEGASADPERLVAVGPRGMFADVAEEYDVQLVAEPDACR